MKNWVYEVVADLTISELNALGAIRWELICVVSDGRRLLHFFKREEPVTV